MERVEQAPLAIVGMACRVPGADNLGEFWKLLLDGRSGIVEVPADRLDQSLHYDPKRGIRCKTYTKLGGVIQYKPFDAVHCPTPSNLLPAAEIGHQTICQVAADACRHAGQNPFDLPLRNAGVYIGHNLGGPVAGDLIYGTRVAETAQYLHEVEAFVRAAGDSANEIIDSVIRRIRDSLPRRGRDGAPQSSVHLGGAIISEALGLTGPTQVLDAACSSALQGLAMASRALRLGRIDMAIVGGASYFHVDSLMLFSKAQSASAKGSRPFDEEADGLVSGEGYAAIVVKTLERALADGDPIHGVIRGIGVSSDGRGKSLWAPRKEGQVLAMRRAYGASVDIGRLQFIEAHATSTRLGDLTEMKAIAEVLRDHFPAGHQIPIGGVKANVGHTLESAGLIGLIKTLLAMQHATIPQQINLQQLNTGIDWEQAPFFVPTANTPWPAAADGHSRRAAVNSFGIGGLNVHVVVDEHVEQQRATAVSLSTSMASAPIAIIGAGCIFPGARTLDGFWDLLDSGRDAISDVPPDRWDATVAYDPSVAKPWHSVANRGGFITDFTYDWRKHKVPPLHVKYADPLQLMILDATDSALADAGYDQKPYDRERVGVVVGTVFGSDFCEHLQMGFCIPDFCRDLATLLRERGVPEEDIAAISEAYADVLLQHMPALLDETGGFTPSTLASRITKTYDLMGGAATIDAGQASSLAAIACAVDALRDGSCDMVICAAGNRAMSLPVFELLSLEGSLDGGNAAAPFDAAAKGYLPGEGVGVLVLKRREDAERDGDRIRGVIRGVGAGYDMSLRTAVSQAVERASRVADIPTSELSFVETSGTGHEAIDQQELEAIRGKLDEGPRSSPLKLGTVVGQIGHTQGASGMASLLRAVRNLEKGETLPTVKATTPIACLTEPGPIQLSLSKAPLERRADSTPWVIGINSTDSAGAAYHLILEGAPRAASKETDKSETARIVRFGAASREQLGLALQKALESPAEMWQRAETLPFQPEHRCRVAIVARGVEDFQARLQAAVQNVGTPKEVLLARQNVFVGETSGGTGKIAFVFAGQGSQYANMLQPLVGEFPAADAIRTELNDTLQKLGCVSFDEVAWKRGDQLGADVWLTQLSLLCADLILYHSLGSLGIRPDIVAGHSFGEFPALAAAGVWDLKNAILGTKARCDAIVSCGDVRGKMLSAAAAGEVLEKLCAEAGGSLYLANYNSPEQTVVGGGEQEIEQLEQRLKQLKIGGKVLPVPRPFHTPLMQPTQQPLRAGLASVQFASPQLPMVSSVTNELVSSAEQARENLIAQMVSPVRYVQLVDQLAQQDVKAIVEVGPRDVLTRLNSKILRDQPIVCLASDDKSQPGVLALLAVQACLETRGLLDPRKPAKQRQAVPAVETQPQSQPAPEPVKARSKAESVQDFSPAVTQLTGNPRDQGVQHGKIHMESLQGMARRFSDISGVVTDADFAAVLRPEFDPSTIWTNDEREELEAIAETVGVLPRMIYAWNVWLEGLGLSHATQAATKSLNARAGLLHGFDAQVANGGPWSEYAKAWELRLIRPATGLAHVVVAQPGSLGSPAGLNERGIAVSVLADASSEQMIGAPVVLHNLLVRRVLRQANSMEEAVKILSNSSVRVGSKFFITDASINSIATLQLGADGIQVVRDVPLAVDVAAGALVAAAARDLPGFLCCGDETADVIRDRFTAVGLLDSSTGETPSVSLEQQIETVVETVESSFLVRMLPSSGDVTLRIPGMAVDQRHHVRLAPQIAAPTSPPEVNAEPQSLVDSPPIVPFPLDEFLAVSQSVDGQPPFDTEGRTCHRFVLRPLHTPKPPVEEILAFRGNTLVIGNNEVSQALRVKLAELGIKTAVLPLFRDRERMLAAVEKAWHSHQPVNLIFATGWDKDALVDLDPENWQERLERRVVMPFLALQKWFSFVTEAGRVEDATVGATSRMGGDLGLSGRIENLEGGALTGLIKSLGIEVGYSTNWHFVSKAVDAPGTEPPEVVAEALLRELRAVSWFAEFGYNRGERYVVGAMHRRPEPVPDSTPTAGKPWLLTGGARGITAAIGFELGKRFGVKLHLVGTSPLPQIDEAWRDLDAEQTRQLRADLTKQALAEERVPNELWSRAEKAIEIDRTLREMQAAGIDVTYHCCDVSDRAALSKVLDSIRQQHGPLEGIIHGAGVENAARLTKKEPEGIERTISSKVSGAAWLMELTQDDPLRYFFGFGSISGRWGSIGQTDYCLASDMLCKLVNWYRKQRPEVRACSFHWQPWDEVGMAARIETRGGGLLEELNLLSPKEGIEHFMAELLAGAPENEVLITDWQYYKRYHPDLKEEEIDRVFIRSATANASVESPAEVSVPHPEIDWEKAVAARHVLRPVVLPWNEAARQEFRFSGAAWILGENRDAVALRERLASEGVPVHPIPIHESIDKTLSELQWLWGQNPGHHLFLMTGRDETAGQIQSPEEWSGRRQAGVVLPFLVCQKWIGLISQANHGVPASVVAVTSLGGDWGFTTPVPAPEGGALAGLLKGMWMECRVHEQDNVQLKIIDAPPDEPSERLADAVVRELQYRDIGLEVAFHQGQRTVARLAKRPIKPPADQQIERGGNWIFTGGARGITAAVAKELGKRYGLKLQLLGMSPPPQIDQAWLDYDETQLRALKREFVARARQDGQPIGEYWDRVRKDLEIASTLRELSDAGVKATYHRCDVTDWDHLRITLDKIRAADGPVHGIVHGAGVQGPAISIGETTEEILSELIAVKVDALMALMQLTKNDPVRYLAGFGSISGRFGSFNAAAYALGSDAMCKLIGWYRGQRPDCAAVGFHWHPWGEVGMMTRPVAQHTIKVFKMNMMSPLEGTTHLINEFRGGAPESEVLISDSQFYEAFYSPEILVDEPIEEPTRTVATGALIDVVEQIDPGRSCAVQIKFDPVADPFLSEHRLRDRPTLPMVVALEAFAEVGALLVGKERVRGIRDAQIADAVRFYGDDPISVRITADAKPDGIHCLMTSDFRNRRGQLVQKDRPHFSAIVEVGDQLTTTPAQLPDSGDTWFDMTYPERGAVFYHGLPLRLLKRMTINAAGGFGQIEIPVEDKLCGSRSAAGWLTPSAALDACYYACGVFTWCCADQGICVPHSLQRLRLGREPQQGEQAVVHLTCQELGDKFGQFDITLIGADQSVLLQADGYRCHILRGGTG